NKGLVVLNEDEPLSIKAQDIQFGFPDERNNIIDELSFDIKSNEKVLLIGKSGSGKTLLLQILSGVHKIKEGELYINDIPFNNYNINKLHDNIGVAFPTNQIFEGTLKENITLGRTVSEKELSNVIHVLRLSEFFSHQTKGIESFVDSGGRRLPRSIIQKLLIARIIISKPRLLLLEDPLQFVEEEEKIRIINYLMSPERNWTVIVISDFYYWKEKCSQIINLNKKS
ncbi:MAG: ATP-binding cassette domain-containing protein, partial [Saprospiraceae bacterium]|nr:ATP-binding cassette domain-containing protein [Saprospiraceae bacterium]